MNVIIQTPIKILKIFESNFTCIKKFITNMDFTPAIINATDKARLPRFIPATAIVIPVRDNKPIQTKTFIP